MTEKRLPLLEGRCSGCKHWNPWQGERRGHCRLGSSVEGEPEEKASLAYALNYEGPAGLVTASNFGCVQWEGKSSSIGEGPRDGFERD